MCQAITDTLLFIQKYTHTDLKSKEYAQVQRTFVLQMRKKWEGTKHSKD